MSGKQIAGLAILLGAVAGGIYAYSKGWYSAGPVQGLTPRQQSLKWMGEQMRYRGRDVDVHEFVDGGTGLSSVMQSHLSNQLSQRNVRHAYEQSNNDIGRPY
jgi:hypothetical protein